MKLYNCCVRAAYSHRSSQQPRVNSHQLIYEPVVLSEHCAPVYIFHANSPATCARLPAPTRALFLIGCIAFCAFVVGADAAPVAFSHIVWLLYVFSSLFFVSYVVVVIATIAHSTQWRFCHIHIADSNASWTLCVRACVCLYFTALFSSQHPLHRIATFIVDDQFTPVTCCCTCHCCYLVLLRFPMLSSYKFYSFIAIFQVAYCFVFVLIWLFL